MKRLRGILFLVFILFFAFPVLGENDHAILQNITGDVQHRGSEFFHRYEPASEGMAVYSGETVRVGMGSRVELIFPDGVEVLLRAGTEVRLHIDEIGDMELRVLRVDEGEVVVKHDAGLLDRIRFEVETPSAVAAVRGTVFRVRSDEWLRTTASVQIGELAVSSHNPSTVLLTAGMMTTVDQNQPPLPPFPITEEEQDLWDEDEDWLQDDEDEDEDEDEDDEEEEIDMELLEEKVTDFYQRFASSYGQKDIQSLLQHLHESWTSDSGDTVDTLTSWLDTLFAGYDSFTVNLEVLDVQLDAEDEERIMVRYSMAITAIIEEYDYVYQEEGVIEDILLFLPEEDLQILFSSSN